MAFIWLSIETSMPPYFEHHFADAMCPANRRDSHPALGFTQHCHDLRFGKQRPLQRNLRE